MKFLYLDLRNTNRTEKFHEKVKFKKTNEIQTFHIKDKVDAKVFSISITKSFIYINLYHHYSVMKVFILAF